MPSIILRCPGCNARIKAPAELQGQQRRCPGCDTAFVVRTQAPPDTGPVLAGDQAPASQRGRH
jgi:hypothetical protein